MDWSNNRPNWTYPDSRLLIFAKPPIAGQVKTRLHSVLSPNQCARLQQVLIRNTLEMSLATRLCPVELWCATPADHSYFQDCQKRYAVPLYQQQGDDLGARMQYALEHTLKDAASALLIGTDCAVLKRNHLQQALQLLDTEAEARGRKTPHILLIPAEDGGYVLIGAKRNYPETLWSACFSAIDWGSSQVMQQTMDGLEQAGINWAQLPPLWDIDRPADLLRLRKNPTLGLQFSGIL